MTPGVQPILHLHNLCRKYDKQDQQGRRRSMNATPIRPSNKNQWQGGLADPKQKLKLSRRLLHNSTNHMSKLLACKILRGRLEIEKNRIPKENPTRQHWKCWRLSLIEPVHGQYWKVQVTALFELISGVTTTNCSKAVPLCVLHVSHICELLMFCFVKSNLVELSSPLFLCHRSICDAVAYSDSPVRVCMYVCVFYKLCRELKKSSCEKPLVQFQPNLAGLILW
jgi:hypothetical protein